MDYYGPMLQFHRYAPLLLAFALGAHAQTADTSPPAPAVSAMDGELFYQLLLGELSAQGGEPGTGYSLILDAARKTGDSRLYQRAVEIALHARSGESALQAARAWKVAQPNSRDANRYLLQILIGLNRVSEAVEPLKRRPGLLPGLPLDACGWKRVIFLGRWTLPGAVRPWSRAPKARQCWRWRS
jgi:hypothetical protein